MADILLDQVTKRFPDGALAVDNISLDITDGEFVILVGPSGCGKSTTLNMIAGLEDITSGELRIGGKLVNDKAPKDRDIAMVFQSYALFPHLSVADNVGYPLKVRGVSRQERRERVAQALETVRLVGYGERRPAQLSGGQQQRVALARALVFGEDLGAERRVVIARNLENHPVVEVDELQPAPVGPHFLLRVLADEPAEHERKREPGL